MKRAEEIIQFVKELKTTYKTKDPFALAEHFGISVSIEESFKDITAYTTCYADIPTVIFINAIFSETGRMVLCAHELGHALLHKDNINYFAVTQKNLYTGVEYEANLFAVALLFDENDFRIPLTSMSNYNLKSILEKNIK